MHISRSIRDVYTIIEHGSFTRGGSLPANVFDELECVIVSGEGGEDGVFTLSSTRGVGRTIKANSFVGSMLLPSGDVIEVLPKIQGRLSLGDEIADSRSIVLDMLAAVFSDRFKEVRAASLNTSHMDMLEIFIQVFVCEVDRLLARGLAYGYSTIEDDETFLRGRLIFPEHIRRNSSRHDRFYVEHDLFDADRPENRVIKTTVELLRSLSKDTRNRRRLREQSETLEDVPTSRDAMSDLAASTTDRETAAYRPVLEWCELFLSRLSPTPFHGAQRAPGIFFNMNDIFQNYVAAELARHLTAYRVRGQGPQRDLFEAAQAFTLKPDITVSSARYVEAILDTKWKLLASDGSATYGVRQADVYQMLAYHRRYSPRRCIALVYPHHNGIAEPEGGVSFTDDDLRIEVTFFDLTDKENSLRTIARRCGLETSV